MDGIRVIPGIETPNGRFVFTTTHLDQCPECKHRTAQGG